MQNSDIEIQSLASVPFDQVTDAFLTAFADYELKLDKESLSALLKRRGASMELSFAAWAQGRIVSFILNGIGRYNGRATAYDTGTGPLKEYRGLGLTDRIFNYSVDYLVKAGIETYLLEVLTHNLPAVKIYSRQGFAIARELDCYTRANTLIIDALHSKANEAISIGKVSVAEIEPHASFMDFRPSWQNTLDSIKRNPDAFVCLMAYEGTEPVGWGVSETAYGDISLVAVDGRHRRQGVGARLLLELVRENRIERAKMLNVDAGCEAMKDFLTRSGFERNCRQYEMCKELK